MGVTEHYREADQHALVEVLGSEIAAAEASITPMRAQVAALHATRVPRSRVRWWRFLAGVTVGFLAVMALVAALILCFA